MLSKTSLILFYFCQENQFLKIMTSSGSGNKLFTILLWVFFIWAALSFVNKKMFYIPLINDFNSSIFGKNSKILNKKHNKYSTTLDRHRNNAEYAPIDTTELTHVHSSKREIRETPTSQKNTGSFVCYECNGEGYSKGCSNYNCKNGIIHCKKCGGTGHTHDYRTCLDCRGSGMQTCNKCGGLGPNFNNPCWKCDGCKKLKTTYSTCFKCKGKGQTLPPGQEASAFLITCTDCNGTGQYESSDADCN